MKENATTASSRVFCVCAFFDHTHQSGSVTLFPGSNPSTILGDSVLVSNSQALAIAQSAYISQPHPPPACSRRHILIGGQLEPKQGPRRKLISPFSRCQVVPICCSWWYNSHFFPPRSVRLAHKSARIACYGKGGRLFLWGIGFQELYTLLPNLKLIWRKVK